MNKRIKLLLVGLMLFGFGTALTISNVDAETRKKLQTGIQLIYDAQDINDNTDDTTGVSNTVDLSGGQLDTCDFQVYVASGATSGSPTLDFTVQQSSDGGTNWATSGTFTQITTTNTATNAVKQDVVVAPGNKMRVLPTLSANTTFYSISMRAVCKAD